MMNYSNWLLSVFPSLDGATDKELEMLVEKAKADRRVLLFINTVVVFLVVFIVFDRIAKSYSISLLQDTLGWCLLLLALILAAFVAKLTERPIIKGRLRKMAKAMGV